MTVLSDTNNEYYNNFLLSKYNFLLKPNLSFQNLNLILELKYIFKNLDETLLVFWLFFILNNKQSPKVRFSKFNKKVCFLTLNKISLDFLCMLLEDFLYNTKYTSLKKKKVTYLSDKKFLYNYSRKKSIYFFCYFYSVFKQNHLEHIFYDLGVSGLKLFFKLVLKTSKFNSEEINKINLYKDLVELGDFEHIIKNNMFEEITLY